MRKVNSPSQDEIPKQRPAETPEGRQNQMISYAMDCAEEQLRKGTASSAVICHFLKLATAKEELEKEKLELEKELLRAKTEALQSSKAVEELYAKAIESMQVYSGRGSVEEDY